MLTPVVLTMLLGAGAPPAIPALAAPAMYIVHIDDDAAAALEQVRSLTTEFDQTMRRLVEAYYAAKTPEDQQAVMADGIPQPQEVIDKIRKIAAAHAGAEVEALAADWTLANARNDDDSTWAFDTLVNSHLDSPHTRSLPRALSGVTQRELNLMNKLLEHGATNEVRMLAAYYRSEQLQRLISTAQRMAEGSSRGMSYRGLDAEVTAMLQQDGIVEKLKAESLALLERCVANGQDIEYSPYPAGSTIASAAESKLFEIRNLQIGCVAPDIEGVDAEGIAFKLSDYRGQVVVLDFWGFW